MFLNKRSALERDSSFKGNLYKVPDYQGHSDLVQTHLVKCKEHEQLLLVGQSGSSAAVAAPAPAAARQRGCVISGMAGTTKIQRTAATGNKRAASTATPSHLVSTPPSKMASGTPPSFRTRKRKGGDTGASDTGLGDDGVSTAGSCSVRVATRARGVDLAIDPMAILEGREKLGARLNGVRP